MTTHAVVYGLDRETHERALLDGLVRLLGRADAATATSVFHGDGDGAC
ncbi:MAG TPA: hypothetical protein VFH48_01950 [Chloroflexota bacterium]|nr:hypothetical protein [Chloroflexota bacterium]